MPDLQKCKSTCFNPPIKPIVALLLTWLGVLLLIATPTGALFADIDTTDCQTTADPAPRLTCDLRYVPTEDERDTIHADSGGMIENLRCVIAIDIARTDAAAVIGLAFWTSPPQFVSCEVFAASRSYNARFRLTSDVSLIGDSRAISVKLRLDAFEGLPPLIANALQSYVRFNSSFQETILSAINTDLKSWLE